MFKKFDDKENVGNTNIAKSSVQKGIRNQILDQFQHIEDYLDQIMPKKEPLKLVKCTEHIELLSNQAGEVLFFRQREGPLYPSLRLLHKYPFILPHMQVDKGAIRFVLSGANIMCPGLTSPGARMTNVDKDQIVAIMAEGKQHALAVGLTKMPTEEILSKNKGVGVDNIHFLNDGLWLMKPIK
ncbi:malignant T-cell-amplified sequence 1 [Biomphalaria glabrata]|uniref:Malignant T-cell-amplified sequence 1-like n=1 Tax=Biomphalaria glabrata TaxID=6526 RepID=A0A2C9JC55_BIOGL|nr:malignant T-cell-amplified sequence 1-like [Biomphalaria glabrata]KAI8757382.1 malignant T-cell-amplified sequence 1-like [Biomphalaria glabrata]KAI8798869.1 malignant T-cell-amplified sequence 1 [Biomphalaria glabrata]